MNALDNAVPIHGKPAGACALVIFGAAGDLTMRKLVPALFNLARQRLLAPEFAVIGFARREFDDAGFRAHLGEQLPEHAPRALEEGAWDWLQSRIHYVAGSFDDDAAFARLAAKLGEVAREHGTGGNVLYYLATGPEHFAPIVAKLETVDIACEKGGCWKRVVVEKPFGSDLASARALNAELAGVLDERQIYRIDHYLGKETVQNLMVLRFANGIFEPVWNRRYVDHVQITVAETLGVEKRGNYYDHAGALRDMLPSHVFQLVSLIALEPPTSFEANALRDEQVKLLRTIRPPSRATVSECVVRGQYAAGAVAGRALPDYRGEEKVAPRSHTETYVAMKLALDNWRWSDVPFYLRVGKALSAHATEIAIQFKRPPLVLFRSAGIRELEPNTLVIRIQPNEGISLAFGAKIPGATLRIGGVEMDFAYAKHFGAKPATGYERLLYDAMLGDQTLFQRADMVEASWAVVQPVLDSWSTLPPEDFPNYRAGTSGPRAADAMLERDGRAWREIA